MDAHNLIRRERRTLRRLCLQTHGSENNSNMLLVVVIAGRVSGSNDEIDDDFRPVAAFHVKRPAGSSEGRVSLDGGRRGEWLRGDRAVLYSGASYFLTASSTTGLNR